MTSQIDPTVPVYGSPTTQSVRDNFAIAKSEITDLQARVAAPPITINENHAFAAAIVASCSIYIDNTSSAPLDLTLPPDGFTDQMLRIKDVRGNAGTYPITLHGPIDGNPTYPLMSDFAGLVVMWTGSGWGTI